MGESLRMESIVNCPGCKREVSVILKLVEVEKMDFVRDMARMMGLGTETTDSFSAEGIKCSCGKKISVLLSVTVF